MTRRLTPDQDLERMLEKGGGEFGAIYARLSRPEPPRRLDRVVLANAARAVHGSRPPRAQRWALAMGSVTGVVLAAGIAWQVGIQMETREHKPEGAQGMQDSRVVPVEAITEHRPREKAKRDQIMRESEARAEAKEELSAQQDHARQIPAAPPLAEPANRPAAAASPPLKSNDALGKAVAPQTPATVSDQVEAEAFPETADAASNESGLQRQAMQDEAKKSAAISTGGAAPMQSSKPTAQRQSASAASSPSELSANPDMQLSPEAWVKEIERLVGTGQHQEAIESLRAFRKRYPDWPLPDALRQLEP